MSPLGRAALVTAGAATATIAVDRALKAGVERTLDERERASGPLGVTLLRTTNRSENSVGALAAGGFLAVAIAGAAMVLRQSTAVQLGAGMVAGGMAANLVDRASGDGVTDFLPTPLGVINAADAAIAAGLVVAGIGLALR